MTKITYEMLVDWRACYLQDERADLLRRLFTEPASIRDVLTRKDCEWSQVPAEDRIWVATRPGVLPDSVLRLAACDTAESLLLAERAAGREPPADSWAAVEAGRRHAIGKATNGDLAAARAAAWAAAGAAARDAAWVASVAAIASRLDEYEAANAAKGGER